MHCDDFSNECTFYIEFDAPNDPTLLWYHFIFENYDFSMASKDLSAIEFLPALIKFLSFCFIYILFQT